MFSPLKHRRNGTAQNMKERPQKYKLINEKLESYNEDYELFCVTQRSMHHNIPCIFA